MSSASCFFILSGSTGFSRFRSAGTSPSAAGFAGFSHPLKPTDFLRMLDRLGETPFNFAAARLVHRFDEFGDLINFRFGDRHGLATARAAARLARNLFT